MDCKDGSDEFNCVYPTTVSTTTMVNSTQAASATTIVPTMAASSLANETLLLPNVDSLVGSDVAMETYGGYETLRNNNDNSTLSNVKQPTTADSTSGSNLVDGQNQTFTVASVPPIELGETDRLLGVQQQQQQQQLSASSVAPVAELMASSSAISSVDSGFSNGDTATSATSAAADEVNSSQQQMANDAKTSYVVDDTKQLSDIQINNTLQPQDKAQLDYHQHQIVPVPREQQQTQKQQLASIPTKLNNQATVTSSYAPSIIINNSIRQQTNEVASSIDSSSSAQPQSTPSSMFHSNSQVATDNLVHDDNNQQKSLNSMNNQHFAHQQRLQFKQQQQPPLQQQQQQQQNFPSSQHMHLQQARRLFSSFNKYTGQTQQSRAPKLHQNNKVPIYRSWINSLTGNHFNSHQQNPQNNLNFQAPLDNAPLTSFRQKRDRLMASTQMPPSTISASLVHSSSSSVSPHLPSTSSAGLGSSSLTTSSSTPSLPPFLSTQASRGAASYFQLLSRYNLAGHRSPKSIPLIDTYNQLQPQQSMINQQNRPVKRQHSSSYIQRSGPSVETLVK